MKALLIVPNFRTYDAMPSLSAASLKAFVNERTSHQARIADLVSHKGSWKEYLTALVTEFQPDVVGLTVLSFNYPEAMEVASFLKERWALPVIVGGVHAILSPQEVVEHPAVDMVCTGEGEGVLQELLDRGLSPNGVAGLWYKDNGTIVKNEARPLIEDLDSLPPPDLADYPMDRYFVHNLWHLPVMASRGCPYSCTYCSNHALRKALVGRYVRFRSVGNVLDEIETRLAAYPTVRFLYFFDDTFILREEFVKEFCTEFMRRGLHKRLRWTVNVRANLVTDEVMAQLKAAGCYEVRMGVESGSDYIRNQVYKRTMTAEELTAAFAAIHRHGLRLRLDFIVGAPDETTTMMWESLALAKASGADRVFFSRLFPLPGTEIKGLCEQAGVVDTEAGGMPGVRRTKHVTAAELDRFLTAVSRWQIRTYLAQGFRKKRVVFVQDILRFLVDVRPRYDLELNQTLRWNLERYALGLRQPF